MTPRAIAFALLGAFALPAQAPLLAGRVLARGGERAAGARVVVRWRMAPELPGLCGISLGDAGLGEQWATADARGDFSLALPHRGPFEVRAELDGDRATPCFPVMAGNFVELRLAAPVVVAGVVTDAEGAPIANRAVRFVPETSAWCKFAAYRVPEWRGSTQTDAQGRFELPFHGAYARERRWEGFVVLDVDVAGLAAKNLELLRPTQHCRELTLRLVPAADAHPRAPRALPRAAAATAAGPAVAPASAPLRRVAARLRAGERDLAGAPVLWSQLAGDGAPREVSARTDASGAVALADAAAGSTLLGFVARGDRWLPFARLALAGEDLDLGTVAVDERALAGQVLDADGTPVAGARIAVMSRDALDAERPYVTYADHGGRYQFAALPPGPLRVWAECGPHGFAAGTAAADQRACDLRAAASGEVVGTVVDGEGKPFAGAWLVLVRAGTDTELMPGLRPGSTHLCVLSAADGSVRVRGLPEGSWQIIGNSVRDDRLFGGSASVATGGEFALVLRQMRE